MSEITAFAGKQNEGVLEVLHVLLLLQGSLALLAGAAMLLFMGGNPLAWPLTLGTPLLLFVAAAGIVRGWRWARKAAVAVQVLTLVGFALSMLLGLIDAVDFSLNLMTLITNLGLPLSILALLKNPGLFAATRSRARSEDAGAARMAA